MGEIKTKFSPRASFLPREILSSFDVLADVGTGIQLE